MSKTNFLIIIIVFASFLIGCGDDEIADSLTLDEQRVFDSTAIAEYIIEKGIDQSTLDTTASGVIYYVLEEGAGVDIEYNDIVNLYFSAKNTDGTLLQTNIDSVLENYNPDLYDSTTSSSHLVITHTQTGWPLLERNFLRLYGFVGIREGLSAVLSEMNVGGRGVIISPSVVALQNELVSSIIRDPLNYWSYEGINEPMVFEVYPTFARQ